jgi:diguanylate cyclase (GGDEF)-like protein
LDFWNRLRLKSLLLPGGLLLGVAALLIRFDLPRMTVSVVELYFYTAFPLALVLAWRFHSGRIFSALVLLLLAQSALEFFRVQGVEPGLTALEAISFLLPVNLAALGLTPERGFTLPALAPRFLLLFVESILVALICRPAPAPGAHLFHGSLLNPSWFAWTRIPQISWLVLAIAMGVLITRFVQHRKPVDSGLAWCLLSAFLGIHLRGVGSSARAYFATSAVILGTSIIETSYSMAYHDELTGLPSRRAFNDALFRLEAPYAVAVVDVDHFKSVNDTYGHDAGDDVLGMVAGQLARVTGGGRAFRIGGEEFTILFPGQHAQDVLEPLEVLRASIERSVFQTRGSDRRTVPRGPERRKTAGSKKKASRGRRPGQALSNAGDLSVTVSIGVAEPASKDTSVEAVIELADKALYRAKKSGRNRVELATLAPGRANRRKPAQDSA